MAVIPLTSGAYTAQSLIADAQRCRNLYPERNPPETHPPVPFTHYPRPGLTLLRQPPVIGRGRCLYPATNGALYAVIDQAVYYIDPNLNFTNVGGLITDATTPVSMADNGTSAIVVDGSSNGYQIVLSNNSFQQLVDPNFLGSTRADFQDSFIVLNKPGTNQWYSSQSSSLVFNGLYVGVKTAWPDNILCVVAVEREIYVFGPQKSEVWYNAGGVPFPFNIQPGNIIEQGCAAQYSPAKMDVNVYWLSQSPEGDRMVMRGNSQNIAQRISTHAIEAEWRTYPRIDDAIGSVYQVSGHSFYKLHFPTADKTWGFDESTQQWHEDNWIDSNGQFHRARNTFCAFAYGKNLALDWQNGNLYQIDPIATGDQIAPPNSAGTNVSPIVCVRSFPHVLDELKRINFSCFTADVATGTGIGTGESVQILSPWNSGFSSGFGPITPQNIPQISMRMSRNGGYQFGNNRIQSLVGSGNYRQLVRWRNNGISRDAVFELSFTADTISALNGAYVDVIQGTT